jgi:hypothetical protein
MFGCANASKYFTRDGKYLVHLQSKIRFPETAGSFKIWPKLESARALDSEGKYISVNYYEGGASTSSLVSQSVVFVYPKVLSIEQESDSALQEIRKTSAKFKVEKVYFSPYGARFVQYRFRGPSSFGLSNVLADQIGGLVVAELNDQTLKFKLSFDSKDRDAEKKTKMFVESFLEIQKTQK